jgi:predicted alpha/beta-hydrolase family hydrolase
LPTVSIRALADNAAEPKVRGYLHTPETSKGNGLVLTHGAGANAQAPLLVALAETFAAAGFTVLRCDLPFRQSRSFGPPGPADAARDRSGLRNAIFTLRNELGAPRLTDFARGGNSDPSGPSRSPEFGKIFLGGHSYGGRQSSMLCAELSEDEMALVAGLLLLSYPLHPPRKPEQQRTQHLPDLRTPTLFMSGMRDPFGSIAELGQALKMIPAKTKLVAMQGAGHDLGFKGKAKKEELPKQIYSEFVSFFDLSS